MRREHVFGVVTTDMPTLEDNFRSTICCFAWAWHKIERAAERVTVPGESPGPAIHLAR